MHQQSETFWQQIWFKMLVNEKKNGNGVSKKCMEKCSTLQHYWPLQVAE